MKGAAWVAAIALTSGITVVAQALTPVKKAPGKERQEIVFNSKDRQHLPSALFLQSGSLSAGFTVPSKGTSGAVWSENFDDDWEGWTRTDNENFAWERKQSTGTKAFTAIAPDDKNSLFIEGTYRYYERGDADVVSPSMVVPKNGKFTFYVGYSLNMNDYCTLKLLVDAGDGNWVELWSSLNEEGDKPWKWRKVEADMATYEGKTVKFKFLYSGYMDGFYIDGLELSGASAVDKIEVQTGEVVKFADASEGTPTSWQWHFPGGVPETSSEQYPEVYYTKDGVYDVSLTVGDGTATSTKTIEKFVTVKGTAPVAKIGLPATFRYLSTRLPMIAPLAPVTFTDASAGFPTQWAWSFTGVEKGEGQLYESSLEAPKVQYNFQHQQSVGLEVSNMHGSSSAAAQVSVEYEGAIANLQAEDELITFDLSDGYGEFPGTNKLDITDYAEHFSKPSAPMVVYGVNVYFTKATTTELIDQIKDVKVSINRSENGLPGEQLEFASWRVFELELPTGTTMKPTSFEFSKPVTIDDDFFIVVSGIPEKSDGCTVAFACAAFRDQGNTAYFKQRGEWKSASSYFPAGSNHTSYAVTPVMAHSVMSPLSEAKQTVGAAAGEASYQIFSYMGYKTPVEGGADWCRVVSEPNGLTVDDIRIAYDALPSELSSRSATFTLTDGLSTLDLVLEQTVTSGVSATIKDSEVKAFPSVFSAGFTIVAPEIIDSVDLFDAAGRKVAHYAPADKTLNVDGSGLARGIYFVKVTASGQSEVLKVVKR